MLLKSGRLAVLSGLAALAFAAGLSAATPARIKSTDDMNSRAGPVINPETAPGRPVFEQHCAMCHLGGVPKAPSPNFLAMLAPDAIVSALTNGVMRQQAASLSPAEKVQVAEYLTRTPYASYQRPAPPPRCKGAAAKFDMTDVPADIS